MARRIRAARSYAGLSQPDLADALEVSIGTVKRIEADQRQSKRSELLAIAEACQVPMWFLEEGWDGWRANVESTAETALRQVPPRSTPNTKRGAG